MTGRQKSLYEVSLQTVLVAKKVGVTSETWSGKEILGAGGKKKGLERVLQKLLHPRPVTNSSSENKCLGNLVSKVILQALCLLVKCHGGPLNPVNRYVRTATRSLLSQQLC